MLVRAVKRQGALFFMMQYAARRSLDGGLTAFVQHE